MADASETTMSARTGATVAGSRIAVAAGALAILPAAIVLAFWFAPKGDGSERKAEEMRQENRLRLEEQLALREEKTYQREVGLLAERLDRLGSPAD